MPVYCVQCDKKLTEKELAALSELEKKYYYFLCSKHLREHRREAEEAPQKYDSSTERF